MRDLTETYLGPLCIRGHEYQSTGETLRYACNHVCVECTHMHNTGKIPKGRLAKTRAAPRKSLSVSGRTYAKLQSHAKARGIGISTLIEKWVAEELGG